MSAMLMPESSQARSTRGVFIAALCVAGVALGLRLCFLSVLYDGDMELFVYMGKLVSHGGRIGIELIDNKLPTVGLLMFAPYQLLGNWWMGYALLSIVMAIASVLAMVRAATLINASARWPTLAIAAAWMGFPLAVFSAFKLEHVQLLTGALAAMAFVQCWRGRDWRDAFTVGLCAGLGALAKPTALSVCAAAGFALLMWNSVPLRERVRLLLALTVGVAIPLAAVLVYLVGSGAIDAMPAIYRQIRTYNQNSVWVPFNLAVKIATVLFLLGVPILMRLFLERRSRMPAAGGSGMLMNFAVAWVVIEAVGIALQGRMYGYHFLPLTAPATLLFALIPRRARALTTLGSALPVLILSIAWTCAAVLATKRPDDRLEAIEYVKANARASDAVWMDETARLLVESDIHAGARVPLTFLFSNHDDAPQEFSGLLLQDFETRRPNWIVLPTHYADRARFIGDTQVEFVLSPKRREHFVQAWDAVGQYVLTHYTPAARCGEQTVYRLNDAAAVVSIDRDR